MDNVGGESDSRRFLPCIARTQKGLLYCPYGTVGDQPG